MQIICGDSLKVVSSWKSNSIDALLTDPPYGLEFMGKDWDKGLPGVRFWREFLRITKPGGFLLCFGGTRTYHRLACAIEDAGWEIRDCMMWLYGSGFPKSHNISKAIDKAAGAKRKVIGVKDLKRGGPIATQTTETSVTSWNKPDYPDKVDITIPATDLAQIWDGYGTALKPAWEPIIVAMKPLDGTFAHNAEAHGVAGLNIDAARIGTGDNLNGGAYSGNTEKLVKEIYGEYNKLKPKDYNQPQGRWPANLVLDEEAAAMLDEQTGNRKGWTGQHHNKFNPYGGNALQKSKTTREGKHEGYKDSGGASRFFYCAKTSRKERNMGMEDCEDKLLARSGGAQGAENRGEKKYLQDHIGLNRVAVVKNNHPTVKPLALMKYLCTLLKMPSASQIILDPFMGSGTTGMACASLGISFIGIEKEPDYCEISSKRIAAIMGKSLPVTKNVEMFRATKDFAGGSRRPQTCKVEGQKASVAGYANENLPRISEHRQSIINAASAALRRNK